MKKADKKTPTLTIPFDLSKLTNAADRARQLREEVKAAEREIQALIQKGKRLPPALVKQYEKAEAKVQKLRRK